MSRSNLIFLAVCTSVWLILHQWISLQNQDLIFEDLQSEGATVSKIRPAGRSVQTLPAKVLLIHGLCASKSAMMQMAAEIARWGNDCYRIDLPGHGDSIDDFSLQASDRVVDRAVQALLSESTKPDSPPLVVIGHSFGARAALGAAQRDPRIAAVIALSPAVEPFAQKAQMPVLVVTGEFDFPFVQRGAAFLYEQVTGARLPRLDNPGKWEDLTKSSRLVVLPWSDHSQTLFKASSMQEIKQWLTRISPGIAEPTFSPWAFWARTQLRAVFCILSLLIWFPVVSLLVDVITERKTRPEDFIVSAPACPFRVVWVYAVGASLATVCLLWINPWVRLALMGADYLTALLCITGVLGLAILRPKLRLTAGLWRALVCSLLAWLVLVMACAPWITAEFVHLDLSSSRLRKFPLVFLSVLPFFFLDEQISRRLLQGLNRARLVMLHLASRFVLAITLLLGFFVLRNGQFLVVLILPGLLLTSLLCWCMAAWIHRETDSVAASALFAALSTGWFFSVFFAQL